MFRLQHLIKRDLKKLAENITEGTREDVADAEGDVSRGLQIVEHACSVPSLMLGETLPGVSRDMDVISYRYPLGVTAGICPFTKLPEAGIPDGGCFNIIHGQHDTVNFICDHPDIKAISFVGGDNAVVLLTAAAFGAAGQRCMALSTAILVGEARSWLPELVNRAKQLHVNAGRDFRAGSSCHGSRNLE
ncbi:hypothetical protein OSTOST_03783 [Ostertagia ostertagi]